MNHGENEAIAICESFERLKSGNPLYSNHKRFNLQSDSNDLNGKLDDMYCVEVDRRMSCLDDGPG